MKTNWLYRFVKYLKKIYFRNDKRVAAYLVCVVIATGFWFLNALSKTYTADITAPVVYTNMPTNKILASQLPENLDLTIRAHGFTILRHKLSFLFMPLEFNVNELTNNRMNGNKRSSFAFPSKPFLNELAYQMSNDIEILNMNPDTLYFRFDRMAQRKIKVKPVVQVKLKKQYQISGHIKTTPDSILVSGPQVMIDTMHFAYTQSQTFSQIDKTIQAEASIVHPKQIFFEPGKVTMEIPVEEYTEAEKTIPVQIIGLPENVNMKLFPDKVRVSFQVGLSRFAEIHPEDFRVTVSYSQVTEGKQHLKIKAESAPVFIYEMKIMPEEVEYLIEN